MAAERVLGEGEKTVNEDVGICLTMGEESDAIVEMLSEQLGDELRVSRRATYVKLETSAGELQVDFAEVSEIMGRPFGSSQFQMILSTYYGRPQSFEDKFVVYSNMTAGVLDDYSSDRC